MQWLSTPDKSRNRRSSYWNPHFSGLGVYQDFASVNCYAQYNNKADNIELQTRVYSRELSAGALRRTVIYLTEGTDCAALAQILRDNRKAAIFLPGRLDWVHLVRAQVDDCEIRHGSRHRGPPMGGRIRLHHRDNVARWIYHGLVARLVQFTTIRRAKKPVQKGIPQVTPVEREIVG
jgi:hypothetical protein